MSNRRKFIGIVLKQDEDGRLHYEAEIIPYESSQTGVRHTASEARRIALDMIRLADALDADALAQQEGGGSLREAVIAYLRLPTNATRRELAKLVGEPYDEPSAPGSYKAARGVLSDKGGGDGG